MADVKISAITESTTAPADTDVFATVESMGGTPATKRKAWSVLKTAVGGVDGWIPVSGSWSYATAYTITVPSGAANIYSIGDKLRFKQGAGYKYYYVLIVADTVLTVSGGSDYTVANSALTDIYYSKATSPTGFPSFFNLTAPAWTTNTNPFTNQPINNSFSFFMSGKEVLLHGTAQCHATSGGTGVFIATFTSGELPSAALPAFGNGQNQNTLAFGISWKQSGTPLAVFVAKYDISTFATNSEYFGFTIVYRMA